jgi:hypothetical protein
MNRREALAAISLLPASGNLLLSGDQFAGPPPAWNFPPAEAVEICGRILTYNAEKRNHPIAWRRLHYRGALQWAEQMTVFYGIGPPELSGRDLAAVVTWMERRGIGKLAAYSTADDHAWAVAARFTLSPDLKAAFTIRVNCDCQICKETHQ